MKTSQIINARQFNTVTEYAAAISLPEFTGEWMDLARFLEVPINPKGGRRSIYDAYKSLIESDDTATGTLNKKAKAVSTNVPVIQQAATVQIPVVQSASAVDYTDSDAKEPVREDFLTDAAFDDAQECFHANRHVRAMSKTNKKSNALSSAIAHTMSVSAPVVVITDLPKSKAPRHVDYANEEEFDADMTAWVIANPKQIKTVSAAAPVQPAPAVAVTTTNDTGLDETARELTRLLANMRTNAQIDPAKIAQMIQDAVYDECKELRDDMKTVEMELSTALIELEKQLLASKPVETVTTIQVQVNGADAKTIDGLIHERFEDLLRHVAVRDNVMLVGPAGSGKTTVCENVAQALGLNFYCKSVCAQTSKSELLGYMDASGQFVSTDFRVAYASGGVFILDEIDAGNPNVIAVLNSALANGYCAFADGMVRKHDDFVLIACANTFGTGASREYVGRNQLDSATLDRFSVIDFGYDERLEAALAPDKTFCLFVQAVRKELAGERVVISPRATIQGGKLLAAGCTPQYVLQTRILKGMAINLVERVQLTFGQFYN